jgi:serine/threonine-protein kinase
MPAPPPAEPTWPPPQPGRQPPNPLAPPEPTAQAEAPATEPDNTGTEATPPETPDTQAPEKPGTTAAKPGTSTPKSGTPKTKPPLAKAEPAKPPTGITPAAPTTLEAQLAVAPQTTLDENPDGEAVVLDTSSPRAMKKAGIGLLTLATVPPAAVFEGQMSLGTTPLRKVPMQAGTYKLRIVDQDGVSRLFSAPVELAKEKKYTIRVSDLPLYPE